MNVTFSGADISVTFSHTEKHWKGNINIYDVDIDNKKNKIQFRFLDNYNRIKYRKDLITRGVLSYLMMAYYNKGATPLTWELKNYLGQDWIDSVGVFLTLQQANMG